MHSANTLRKADLCASVPDGSEPQQKCYQNLIQLIEKWVSNPTRALPYYLFAHQITIICAKDY
jgi:hypothetical protein